MNLNYTAEEIQNTARQELTHEQFLKDVVAEKEKIKNKETLKGILSNLISFTFISKLKIEGFRQLISFQRGKIQGLEGKIQGLEAKVLELQQKLGKEFRKNDS